MDDFIIDLYNKSVSISSKLGKWYSDVPLSTSSNGYIYQDQIITILYSEVTNSLEIMRNQTSETVLNIASNIIRQFSDEIYLLSDHIDFLSKNI